MSKAKRINIFASAYHDFINIQDDNDLRNNNLSLSDYKELKYLLKSLSNIDDTIVSTLYKNPFLWLKERGFFTKQDTIGWQISLAEI